MPLYEIINFGEYNADFIPAVKDTEYINESTLNKALKSYFNKYVALSGNYFMGVRESTSNKRYTYLVFVNKGVVKYQRAKKFSELRFRTR